jgi:hypothetical protein
MESQMCFEVCSPQRTVKMARLPHRIFVCPIFSYRLIAITLDLANSCSLYFMDLLDTGSWLNPHVLQVTGPDYCAQTLVIAR